MFKKLSIFFTVPGIEIDSRANSIIYPLKKS